MEKIKVKKKREDVSKRKETKKDTDFVCIKMSWNSLCKNNSNLIRYFRYKLINIFYLYSSI
jgi:hypothetical protein